MADKPVSPYLLRSLRTYEEALADRLQIAALRAERQRRAAERAAAAALRPAEVVPLKPKAKRRPRARAADHRQLTLPLVAAGRR